MTSILSTHLILLHLICQQCKKDKKSHSLLRESAGHNKNEPVTLKIKLRQNFLPRKMRNYGDNPEETALHILGFLDINFK